MRLQPIIYTTDMPAAVAWYSTVLGSEPTYTSDMWSSFEVAGATLGVHRVETLPDRGRVELSLVATEALHDVLARVTAAGIEPLRGIADETFGRSFVLEDPDGSPVQVNEHD
ncbi:MAG: VOC family protein [Acidobacteria bacterium]|nr:VOC family protein [Acidobacteriota bacterium]MCH8991285.1 VOC family protein [Acidobacteriota bacterium]